MTQRYRTKPGRNKTHAQRLVCEPLEDRRLLAVVTDQASLEAAIAAADPAIQFGNDIVLVSEVLIDKPVNIDGMGFILAGSGADRVLNVNDGDVGNQLAVNITNLTVTGGSATSGGGIANAESLTLDTVNVVGNVAYQPDVTAAAFGGGILNTGRLTMVGGSSVSGNSALENNGAGNSAFGGGIASLGIGSTLRLENSTVEANTVQGSGGGIFHRLGAMDIIDSVISNNTADAGVDQSVTGGGIAAYSRGQDNTSGPLDITISGSLISGNLSLTDSFAGNTYPYGGGFYASGYGTIQINQGTSFSGNRVTGIPVGYSSYLARGRGGGAFFAADDGPVLAVEIDEVTFTNNSANIHGGGVAVRGRTGSVADIDITNNAFDGNYARYGGSGVFLWAVGAEAGSASMEISESQITDGRGSSAILNWFGGHLEVRKTTISGNSGSAAIENVGLDLLAGEQPPITVLWDSTISDNYSYYSGGAIFTYDGFLYSYQNTISGNYAYVGGGIFGGTYAAYVGTAYETRTVIDRTTIAYNGAVYGAGWAQNAYHGANGHSSIRNTVISGNHELFPNSPDFFDGGSTFVSANMNYSLVSDVYGSALPLTNSSNKYGDSGGYGNPGPGVLPAGLSPLGFYGGPTQTHVATSAASPIVDMGDPAILTGRDQRMYGRVAAGRMDMGSTEYGIVESLCDLDDHGDCDIDDLDLLVMDRIDYDGNGSFERADIQLWLVEAGASPENFGLTGGCPFLEGDFNLDGVVDGLDFLKWNANKFTSTGKYSLGDANGSGITDGLDFIIWNANKFSMALGSCELNGAIDHDHFASHDRSRPHPGPRHIGKDTSHTQHTTTEVVGNLQSGQPKAVVAVIPATPRLISQPVVTEVTPDVRPAAVVRKVADAPTPTAYTAKPMDLATAVRADQVDDGVHSVIDEVFAGLS